MGLEPHERTLPDLMVGHKVIVKYLDGPVIEDVATFDSVVEEWQVLTGAAEAKTTAFYLVATSAVGIEVTHNEDPLKGSTFIPWGAVLRLHGADRAWLEEWEREQEKRRQDEQMEEGNLT